jgi:hypothetical protein
MSSLLGGKMGPFELLQTHCLLTCPLSLQHFMPPLMCPVDVQLWIQARFVQEGWREGHQELLTKLQTQRLCRYMVNMRVSCVGGCVGESAYLAAGGRAAERAAGNRGTTHCDKVGAAASHRKELLTKLRTQRLCRYASFIRSCYHIDAMPLALF